MTPPSPPAAARLWPRLLLALGIVVAASLRVSWSTLDRYFLCDDFAYLARFHALSFAEWPRLFVQDWSGGIWGTTLPELRPFAALTFLIDAHLWGVNPLGFHLTNFVLDAACAVLVMLIVWRLHDQPLCAGAAAAVLFAWQPAHAEPVAWITGRVDLLGTFAYLAGFLAAGSYLRGGTRRWLIAAWLAYFVGCFSKEFCLTLPLAVGLWWLFYRNKSTSGAGWAFARLLGGFLVVAAAFVACRRLAFGPGSGGVMAVNLFSAAYAERQFDYLRWFLPPLYDFGRDHRPQLVGLGPALIVGAFLVGAAILALWHWRGPATPRWRAVTVYMAGWYLIGTLPLAAAGYFSPRHLYLATAGLAIGAGLIIASFLARRALTCVCVCVAAWYCLGRTDHAIAPWRHAAKLSEHIAAEVRQTVPQLAPGEILLLDVPSIHEGVWLWSWSAPWALQPPFQPRAPELSLTAPSVYFSPGLWAQQPALPALSQAPAARLIRVDAQGALTSRRIAGAALAKPAAQLASAVAKDPEAGWKEFVAALPAQ